MRMVRLNSARSGATPEGRRVLAAVTGATAPPSQADDGVQLAGGLGFYLEAKLGGTAPTFDLDLWVYSYTANEWFKYTSTSFVETSRERFTFPGGPVRLYAQVTASSGTTPTLDLWVVEYFED